jgi:hypothetical protein
MNDIAERALLTDLGRLKGAHNNAVKQFSGDVAKLTTALKQCVAEITRLQQVVAALQQRVTGASMNGTRSTGTRVRAPAPAQTVVAPVPAPPQDSGPSSWPLDDDDEEDADVVG